MGHGTSIGPSPLVAARTRPRTVTLLAHLIASGQIAPPESLSVLYADTRMELPPLHACALTILGELAQRGIHTKIVLPDLDDRFRGVRQLKIEPMERTLADLRQATGEKLLMLTGVRLGESAARDSRIALSCDRDGAECGQGWFQEATPDHVADVLAPLLHWRVCHIWDWLTFHAPTRASPRSWSPSPMAEKRQRRSMRVPAASAATWPLKMWRSMRY